MIKHLARAAGPIVLDAVGMIFFAVLLALKVDLVVATIVGIAIACSLVAWELVRGKPVPPLQWLSVAIVLISAGATLVTHDPRFVMIKPTIVYLAVGAAMLKPGWLNRYVAPDRLALVGDWMTKFGFVWAGLMFVTGVANLVIAVAFTQWWPLFIGTFPFFSKLALFAVHFTAVYAIGRARFRRGETATS